MSQSNYSESSVVRREPLAARMRPRTLDQVVGQKQIIGPGRLLRRAIEADQLSSIILYGPPGTGKTTLARVIANTTRTHFIAINAVLAGVKDLREAIGQADKRSGEYDQRTILFVDEVHRWNKAQQDALLPWVESGTVTLIGATTENPYFEVIKPLVSRSRIFQLLPLESEDLRALVQRALRDTDNGYGKLKVDLKPEALEHLVNIASGDARSLLNALELAVETSAQPDAPVVIDLHVAEESIQRRAVLYDKDGDLHYDTISAFIKSIRGSDPDAALYWLARMVYAGEDPRFLFRRMLVLSAEDVGLADPQAVSVVASCAQAFEYVGMPEGRFHLAEAALYLATAPKSNSVMGFFDALNVVSDQSKGDVPIHLRDASRDAKGFGHGESYSYPHAFRDHWVAQRYLPTALTGRIFYQPSAMGYEGDFALQISRRREEQLAAMLDDDDLSEQLTSAGTQIDNERERWLSRVTSGQTTNLAAIRDRVLDQARIRRHDVAIDLAMSTGLLTWELVRRVPEGGVFALSTSAEHLSLAKQMIEAIPEGERPLLLSGDLSKLGEILQEKELHHIRFDVAVGRGALSRLKNPYRNLINLTSVMACRGRLSLSETDNTMFPDLADLFPLLMSHSDLSSRIHQLQQSVTSRASSIKPELLNQALEKADFTEIQIETEQLQTDIVVSQLWIDRLIGTGDQLGPLAQQLQQELSPEDMSTLRTAALAAVGRTVPWQRTVIYANAIASNRES